MNVVIGYSHPHMTIIPDNVEYVICESEDIDDDDIQLLHKEDLKIDWMDDSTIRISPGEEPQNDHLVKELLNKINTGLVEGVLWFDPGVTRTVDGMTLKVTKKFFNDIVDQDAVFDTNIVGPNMTTMYKYSQICMAASMDRRFKALKKIIDSNWPEMAKIKEDVDSVPEPNPVEQTEIVEESEEQGPVKYLVSYFKNWLKSKL